MHSLKLVGSLAGVLNRDLMSPVKCIHSLGYLKTCLWQVDGRCDRPKKKREREREEMCIVHSPGRSLKSETYKERFVIGYLRFVLLLTSASVADAGVGRLQGEPQLHALGGILVHLTKGCLHNFMLF